MASKSKIKREIKKAQKPAKGGAFEKIARGAANMVEAVKPGAPAATAKKGGGGKRRGHGPAWYASRILKLKMKRKYDRLRFSVR